MMTQTKKSLKMRVREASENDQGIYGLMGVSTAKEEYKEPTTYKQMMRRGAEERENWLEGVRKELANYEKRGVWRIIRKDKVPPGRKLIGSKWVFKLKRDGRYRSRLVALGYSQIPGVDFKDNYSPVVSDIAVRIMIILQILLQWHCTQCDVETAFLEGRLEPKEYMYMKCPEGLELSEDQCVEIMGGMYGLVQVARIFWKRLSDILTGEDVGMTQCAIDQCIFVRRNHLGLAIIVTYVDDIKGWGDKEAVTDVLEGVKKHLSITMEQDKNDFLGCKILMDEEEGTCYMYQKAVMDKIKDKHARKIEGVKIPLTPGAPKKTLQKAGSDDQEKLNEREMGEYRSIVGSLMYLVKFQRPELSNYVRELAKGMQGATKLHEKELKRMLKWVLTTQTRALKLKPRQNVEGSKQILQLKGICDASYAPEMETCKSVTGYIVYLNEAPIDWKSKGQRHVTLSSCESEYVAMSEVVRVVLEAKQILECLGFEVETPIKIYIDNVAAIHVARNNFGRTTTRHVNVRYHFVRELVADGVIEVMFIRTKENPSDILTKNCDRTDFKRHEKGLVEDIPEKFLAELREMANAQA